MSTSRWITKLPKDITHEQTMNQCLNSYLTKIRTFISEKTTFVYAAVLKLTQNLLSILDSYQSCFQCLRLKLTRKIFRQIAIGKMSFSDENKHSSVASTIWLIISKNRKLFCRYNCNMFPVRRIS